MSDRAAILDKFNIFRRAKAFCSTRNIRTNNYMENPYGYNNKTFKFFPYLVSPTFLEETSVAPSISHLESLFFHTIYSPDGPFNLIDYLMTFKTLDSKMALWIENKCFKYTSDDIEARCKALIYQTSNDASCEEELESKFLNRWISARKSSELNSDLLVVRVLETFILLSIIHYQKCVHNPIIYKELEARLMDWSEGIGLIQSLSDNLNTMDSMDLDFNPLSDSSISSSAFTFTNYPEFNNYILEKFRNFNQIRGIVEIIADRCGVPVESDFETENQKPPQPFRRNTNANIKHWRRVKPVSVPVKRIPSSNVKKPSSLSVSDFTSKPSSLSRFPSESSSSRQFDLTIKNHSQDASEKPFNMHRRHSESSATNIIQHKTPTKTQKYANLSKSIKQSNDSFVILETPPRILASKQISHSDLSGSVKRLFHSANEQEK